ncbi:MAG: hypothetical protein ABFC56_11120 [Clostridiaceae bacterium]
MKFRNRILVLLLSILLGFTLISCDKISALIEPTPTATPTATPMPTPTATPEPTPSPTPYREIYPITFGLSTGTSYRNEYFNVKIDLNATWFAETSAELDQKSGFTMEIPKDMRQSEYLDYLPKGLPVQDYSAHMHTGLAEISILVNDAKASMAAFSSVAEYHEANIALIRDAFTKAGATIGTDNHTTTMFAGKQQSCWFFSYDSGGYTTYNAQVILQQGDYSMNVFISTTGVDHTTDILAMFLPMAE